VCASLVGADKLCGSTLADTHTHTHTLTPVLLKTAVLFTFVPFYMYRCASSLSQAIIIIIITSSPAILKSNATKRVFRSYGGEYFTVQFLEEPL